MSRYNYTFLSICYFLNKFKFNFKVSTKMIFAISYAQICMIVLEQTISATDQIPIRYLDIKFN